MKKFATIRRIWGYTLLLTQENFKHKCSDHEADIFLQTLVSLISHFAWSIAILLLNKFGNHENKIK